MAKPLANRVIVGIKCGYAHTHILKCVNLMASASGFSSVNSFVKVTVKDITTLQLEPC